jgi:serine/threonine-protein kinase
VSRLSEIQSTVGDHVELRELVGAGGFAEVYAGTDRRLGRDVAVKVLREDVTAPRARERFLQEARAAAQARHLNALAVFDVGGKGDLVWFTMPLVRGESLRARLDREKRLAPDEASRILRAAAGALHAAHRTGLVHRDVKPDNILLDGPERDVLLADFGVAAAVSGADERLTTEGATVGTPTYMSPEQAAGEPVIDGRSDVYSLGIVGYEMLAGSPPFSAATAGGLLAKHLTAPVPPLRERVPVCPSAIASVVERCLAKDPEDRWPTADALRQALEGRVSSGVLEIGAVASPRSRAAARRRIIAGGVVAIGVVIAIAVDVIRRTLLLTPLSAVAALVAGLVLWGSRAVTVAQEPQPGAGALVARRLRRARALRTAARAVLAGMPKADRGRFGDVELVLDQLLFTVEAAAADPARAGEMERAISGLTELQEAIRRAWEHDPEAGVGKVRELLVLLAPAARSARPPSAT